MSFAVDVNLLLYASAKRDPNYPAAADFMQSCATGPEVCCFAWVTVMSYLRMSTQERMLAEPLSHQAAASNIGALMALPHVRVIAETTGFWQTYCDLTELVPVRGKLVPDAHLAAILRCNGVTTLYTHDRDFRRFDFLDVRDPLTASRRR